MPETKVKGLSPVLVGVTLGISAALPMYLWQSTLQVAVAAFIIAGYTAYLWTLSYNYGMMTRVLHGELRGLPINAHHRRVVRMLLEIPFWWNIIFGGTIVTASVYWAGIEATTSLVGVFCAWCFIASCLSYGLTIIYPSTACRRCGYDLQGQIKTDTAAVMIRCPECGARWSRAQLGLSESTADWRRRTA